MFCKYEIRRDLVASIFSSGTVFLILIVLRFEHTLVLTSFAASCYIMFHLPTSTTVHHRNLVGGHLLGLFAGTLTWYIKEYFVSDGLFFIAIAVGVSSLFMSVLNLHHPPANGTARALCVLNVVTFFH